MRIPSPPRLPADPTLTMHPSQQSRQQAAQVQLQSHFPDGDSRHSQHGSTPNMPSTLNKQPRQQRRQHAVQGQLQLQREDQDRRRFHGGSMARKPTSTGADASNGSSWKSQTHRHNHSVGSNTNFSAATSTTIPSLDPTEELSWWLEL
mmetsp:Transcript_67171/g.129873  ORF Transcript_67171/g.129873 Transcript_67171/m.129873 type:complete len:148 (-) Transcript_67171:641-1084(-)